jgi:hypothetical protein
MINSTKLTIAEIKQKYDSINCHFTYFDGDQYTFDFYGTNQKGTEVRISIGGCPAWIKDISFGPNDSLNISKAVDKHIKYLSVTDNNGKVVYEQFFDLN